MTQADTLRAAADLANGLVGDPPFQATWLKVDPFDREPLANALRRGDGYAWVRMPSEVLETPWAVAPDPRRVLSGEGILHARSSWRAEPGGTRILRFEESEQLPDGDGWIEVLRRDQTVLHRSTGSLVYAVYWGRERDGVLRRIAWRLAERKEQEP